MAIIGTSDDEELQNPTTSSSPNAHAGVIGGTDGGAGFVGGSGTGSGQGATTGVAATGSGANNSTPGGGGYTNLSQYLEANQAGGAAAGQAAGSVVNNSVNTANQAQNAYNTSATTDVGNALMGVQPDFNVASQINAGIPKTDTGFLNKINAAGFNYTDPYKAGDDLSKASQSDLDQMIRAGNNGSNWKYTGPQMADAPTTAYTGPTAASVNWGGPNTISDFKGQTAANQTAAIGADQTALGNAANAMGGQTGVSALLKNAYQQPQYSHGENALDAFLAGGTPGGQDALNLAGAAGTGVSDSYSKINDALTNQIGYGKNAANTTNNYYANAIADAQKIPTNINNNYFQSIQNAMNPEAAQNAAAEGKLASAENARRIAAAKALIPPPVVTAPPPVVTAPAPDSGSPEGLGTASPAEAASTGASGASDSMLSSSPYSKVVSALKGIGGDVAQNVKQTVAPFDNITQAVSNSANQTIDNGLDNASQNVLNPVVNAAKKLGGNVAKTVKRWW